MGLHSQNQTQPQDGSDDVRGWRLRRLVRAGFAPDVAAQLADDYRFDLHAALELVDRDCPPHLAARILAPFDTDVRP